MRDAFQLYQSVSYRYRFRISLTGVLQAPGVHVSEDYDLRRRLFVQVVPSMLRIGVKARAFADLIFVDDIAHFHIVQIQGCIVAQCKWPVSIGPFGDPP